MLFNSYVFLFVFFPISLAIFFLCKRFGGRLEHLAILAVSLFFYAWWDIRFVPLLISSITINYIVGIILASWVGNGRQRAAGGLMAAAIALNLGVLGLFKYAYFTVTNLNAAFGTDFTLGSIILPLGISFFTFEQISFLVDVRRGQTRPSLYVHYALFVSFFPRLVAGPIIRYNEIAPQFAAPRPARAFADDLAVGLTMFTIGLLKKTVLADGVAPYASPVFAAAEHGEAVDFLMAWGGALAYTCQLYFDFSGYSDMAIGAARCFGIRFPMNFDSPYKSTSIIEFWRRWHITLSRFLRDYLYFSLGGNRRGPVRRYLNLLITMLLGGLWHGANWTFIVWGVLHGAYLMFNHAWLAVAARSPALTAFRNSRPGAAFGLIVTFLAVVAAWVFFRSPSFSGAFNLLGGMAGLHGIAIPSGLAFAVAPLGGVLGALGVRFADASGTMLLMTYGWVTALLAVVFLFPNSQQILARFDPVLEVSARRAGSGIEGAADRPVWWEWRPSALWAVAIGCAAFVAIISITRVSEFLYWQF
jgi:D-alanyl-lipoteichoic acid acyltransferase DltB (MBOAT superfamily)